LVLAFPASGGRETTKADADDEEGDEAAGGGRAGDDESPAVQAHVARG
jgi:hypothetical protein